MKVLMITNGHITNSKFRIFVIILAILLIIKVLTLNSYAQEEGHEHSPSIADSEQIVQSECPVMAGNKIDPNIYVDYEGKRVYFCCNICKAAFIDEPQKYLDRLPQFTMANIAHDDDHDLHSHHVSETTLINMIVPMGISTLTLIAATVFLSVFRRLNVRLMMKWHKRVGIAALILGAIHAILVLIAH